MQAVTIDGSYGEGGGQILRTSLALSSLLLRPVEIYNIRAKRRNPGLQHQHLTAVRAAAALTDAEVAGAEIGSTRLVFSPRSRKCGEFSFDIGTAGSVGLVVQTVLPVLMFSRCRSKITIRGGTDVPMAPPVDYLANVMFKLLARMGVRASINLIRRGHYPRGGGLVELSVEPVERLAPVSWRERGDIRRVAGISHAVNLPRHVAERQAKAAEEALRGLGVPVEIAVEHRQDGLGPGSGVVLWAETDRGLVLGADALGERGKPAEAVGREAAEKLLREISSGAALDAHMGDMIMLYMALAEGPSEASVSEITSHSRTNAYIIERFLPVKFSLKDGRPAIISVNGVGFRAGPY
ncbi:RNA 3'-terminal-phosphate cyclase [Thermoproteus uzoniensis 768-20]|uniref:RNA 3'-terminal phosphate cyclase n=1 Tax=Thermoproteus uzoniensis (strain 768-20) TaxID=999630 RepID=F2L406_THEU7|nr:RNA 3'-terminal phosphate cyclase [Thermoproteus uzoniensis]AEA13318.1 RNA 3'-terminal-phosphate cyclase [Thermoproteus uzoniensis 768-20]